MCVCVCVRVCVWNQKKKNRNNNNRTDEPPNLPTPQNKTPSPWTLPHKHPKKKREDQSSRRTNEKLVIRENIYSKSNSSRDA